jgi:hypothetical protein
LAVDPLVVLIFLAQEVTIIPFSLRANLMGMIRLSARRTTLITALLLAAPLAYPCSWAIGYFYQVTSLRGVVVGTGRGWPRSIRQRVTRGNVTLRLFEYRWPLHNLNDRPLIKTVVTDQHGDFDFGVIKEGHYTLVVDWPSEYGDSYDIEIKKLPRTTSSVKIDVSPVYPDCTGGHEFIVSSQ